ncbi:ZRANB2 [Symbiodinium sp. KB8]|nr:ZRANB2 [Symbiodinium sp. KB8]
MKRLLCCSGKKRPGAAARDFEEEEFDSSLQAEQGTLEEMPRPRPPSPVQVVEPSKLEASCESSRCNVPEPKVFGGLCEEITIRLLQPNRPPTQLRLKPSDTILQVKRSIPLQVKEFRRADHRNLELFKGAGSWCLKLNCRTLQQYGIGPGDEVTVVPSLVGSASFDSVPFTPFEDVPPERLAEIRDKATAPTSSLEPFAQMAFERRKALIAHQDFIADRIASMSKEQCEVLLRFWEEGLPYEPPYLDRFCEQMASHFIDELADDAIQLEGLEAQEAEALYNAFLLKFHEKYDKLPKPARLQDGAACFCCIQKFAEDMQARFDRLLEEEAMHEKQQCPRHSLSCGSELPQACVGAADTLVQLLNFIFEQVSESATYNVARLGVGGAHDSQSGLPRFLSALDGFPASVGLDMIRAAPQCHGLHELYRSHHVFDPVSDPAAWRSRDVSGFEVPVPPPQKLLFTISQVLPLAYSLIAVMPRSQSGAQELTSEYKSMFADTGGLSAPTSDWLAKAVAEPSCGGKGLAYSPGHCLVNEGWGSMMFSLSTEPPFDGVLAVSEMTQRDPAKRPQPFVQPVANHTSSLDALVDAADRVYKSLNTPSPDVFFLSPMVGNCLTLRRLGPSRGNKPRTMAPMTGMRAGDWICPACSNHNYADKVMCNRCRIPKPGGWSASPVASKPAREMRPGDWICPSCANHNFADKLFCNRCNHPKEKAGEVPGSGPDLQPPTQAWRFRQGDWMCPACGNHNYSSRTACNRCNAPRPSGSDEVSGSYGAAPKGGPKRESPYQAPGGSWTCVSCGNINWPLRTACNRCKLPRQQAQATMPGSFGGFQGLVNMANIQAMPMHMPGVMGMGAPQNMYVPAAPMPMGTSMAANMAANMAAANMATKAEPVDDNGNVTGVNGGPPVVVRPSPASPPISSMAGTAPAHPAAPVWKQGDWMCPVCNNHNFGDKSHCNRCGIPKETRISDFGIREGDWICLVCANHNFASKTNCNKCHADKENAPMVHQISLGARNRATTRQHNEVREGDWICQYCRNHNYSRRMECNRCKQPKT